MKRCIDLKLRRCRTEDNIGHIVKRTEIVGVSAAILRGILDAILTLEKKAVCWLKKQTNKLYKLALMFSELTKDENGINKFIILLETGNFLSSLDAKLIIFFCVCVSVPL